MKKYHWKFFARKNKDQLENEEHATDNRKLWKQNRSTEIVHGNVNITDDRSFV